MKPLENHEINKLFMTNEGLIGELDHEVVIICEVETPCPHKIEVIGLWNRTGTIQKLATTFSYFRYNKN